MTVGLAEFTSVFEFAGGIILASGVAQALYRGNTVIISELLGDIYRLKEILPLSQDRSDTIDARLQVVEMEYIQKKDEVKGTARALLVGNFVGLLLPLAILIQAPISAEVGAGPIAALILLTVGWGPAWMILSFLVIRHEMDPVIEKARNLKRDLLMAESPGVGLQINPTPSHAASSDKPEGLVA